MSRVLVIVAATNLRARRASSERSGAAPEQCKEHNPALLRAGASPLNETGFLFSSHPVFTWQIA